jgi:predicted nucleic acid-binding protein
MSRRLVGDAAELMLRSTVQAGWRIFVSDYVLDETVRVMIDDLGFTNRIAGLTRERCQRRARLVAETVSRHEVPDDPNDSPILRAALAAGADLLVTNDADLLKLHPYEGLRIISMTDYLRLLEDEGLIPR